MRRNSSILKDTPDYEDYTNNVAKLSKEELSGLGYIKCGGCCGSKKECCKNESGIKFKE